MTRPNLDYIIPELRALAVKVSDLTPDPSNTRRHSRHNIEAIRGSLRNFGQYLPIIVQKQGNIIRVGNGRWTATRQLGRDYIAAIVVDEEEVDAVARAITDNATGDSSEWDRENLRRALELVEEVYGHQELGFDDAAIAAILDDMASDTDPTLESEEETESNTRGGGGDPIGPDLNYAVQVTCRDEHHQRALLEDLEEQGLVCKPLIW